MPELNGRNGKFSAMVRSGLVVLFCASTLAFCANLNGRVSRAEVERGKLQTAFSYVEKKLNEISGDVKTLLGQRVVSNPKNKPGDEG